MTVNRTQPRNSSRSPPLSAWTMTRLPTIESTCQELPAFEAVTVAAARVKLPGISTTTQPISRLLSSAASGSSFVAVRVKTLCTPVVAVSGEAVRVQSRLAPSATPIDATSARITARTTMATAWR